MRWRVNPLRGKTTDWRAVCGRSACTVRREGGLKPALPTPTVPLPLSRSEASALGARWLSPARPQPPSSCHREDAEIEPCSEKPGLQPGGWRFDPARLHSMLNESDRITSHLLFQRPKSRPSALNPARAPIVTYRRHRRHCVIPIEANPPAANRLAHHHRDCVIGVIGVIGVIASYRSKPVRQPRSDVRTIKDRVWME